MAVYLYRNELITTTWLEDPDDRPTFATIVQDINSVYNFTESTKSGEDSIKDTENATESNGYNY